MEEIADGVWRLGTRFVNFYLIREGRSLTLVDSGFPAYAKQVAGVLATLGHQPSDVEALLLTHAHTDHCGGAAEIQALTGARIYVHDGDAPLALGEQQASVSGIARRAWRPFLMRYMVHAVRNGAAKSHAVDQVEAVKVSAALEVPGRPVAIHTPGHSAGSCAFLIKERGVLFSGDALSTLDALTGKDAPTIGPRGFNADDQQAVESVAALRLVEADVILPGHGRPLRGDTRTAIDAALAHGVR
jgi:glyoxylase-like metal-dependent hydrolase (beta-lactamase superfamily II)